MKPHEREVTKTKTKGLSAKYTELFRESKKHGDEIGSKKKRAKGKRTDRRAV